jgi:cell division protease FtsH
LLVGDLLTQVRQLEADLAHRTLDELQSLTINGISVGSQNDIEKATRMLNLMVNRLSMYSRSKIDYTQLGQDGAGAHAIRQVELKSDELYSYTLGAIRDYKAVIESIKDTLLDQYVLSKDAVFALLEERRELLMSHLGGPRLKLCADGAV